MRVDCNFNRIEIKSYFSGAILENGDYVLLGMGKTTEYDYATNEIISEKIEKTGVNLIIEKGEKMKITTLKNWQAWLMILITPVIIGLGLAELITFVINLIAEIIENITTLSGFL